MDLKNLCEKRAINHTPSCKYLSRLYVFMRGEEASQETVAFNAVQYPTMAILFRYPKAGYVISPYIPELLSYEFDNYKEAEARLGEDFKERYWLNWLNNQVCVLDCSFM